MSWFRSASRLALFVLVGCGCGRGLSDGAKAGWPGDNKLSREVVTCDHRALDGREPPILALVYARQSDQKGFPDGDAIVAGRTLMKTEMDYFAPESLANVPKGCVAELLSKSATSVCIESESLESVPEERVVSPERLAEIFRGDDDDWTRFDDAYHGTSGIMLMSRVAFCDAGSKALVFVVHLWGELGGGGFVYLLEKSGGAWTIVDGSRRWSA